MPGPDDAAPAPHHAARHTQESQQAMTTQTTSTNASPARFNYVGEPIRFEGYVDDFEHGVAAV